MFFEPISLQIPLPGTIHMWSKRHGTYDAVGQGRFAAHRANHMPIWSRGYDQFSDAKPTRQAASQCPNQEYCQFLAVQIP